MNRRRLLGILVPGLAAALAGCEVAPHPSPTELPPIAAGMARIYFYRENNFYDALGWTTISLNRQEVGSLGPGTFFYRDVAPGAYRIEPRSDQLYPDQAKTVAVKAGSTTFVRVEVATLWGRSDLLWQGNTFVVRIVDPATALVQIGPLSLTQG